jgi:hypothetical protein
VSTLQRLGQRGSGNFHLFLASPRLAWVGAHQLAHSAPPLPFVACARFWSSERERERERGSEGGRMQGQHGRARGGRGGGYHYRSHGFQPYAAAGWQAYGAGGYGGHHQMHAGEGFGPVYAARGVPRGGILPLGVHGAGILKRPTGPPQGPLLHGRGHQRGRGGRSGGGGGRGA